MFKFVALSLVAMTLAAIGSALPAQALKEAEAVEAAAQEFLKAFVEADAGKMKVHFADKVLVMGTPVSFAAPMRNATNRLS